LQNYESDAVKGEEERLQITDQLLQNATGGGGEPGDLIRSRNKFSKIFQIKKKILFFPKLATLSVLIFGESSS
jgi:hypothetical protein